MLPMGWRARYWAICSSPHVIYPADFAGRVVLMSTVGSFAIIRSSIAKVTRPQMALSQSRCVATGLPASASVMLRRAIVRSAFLP